MRAGEVNAPRSWEALVSASPRAWSRALIPGEGRPAGLPRLVVTFDIPGADGGLLAIVADRGQRRQHDRIRDGGPRRAGREVVESPPHPPALGLACAARGGRRDGRGRARDPRRQRRETGPQVRLGLCRPLEADQSNTSVVVDDRVVIKLYRLLRGGRRSGAGAAGGADTHRLDGAGARGGDSYRRGATVSALATAYGYVNGTPVGWEPAIAELAAALLARRQSSTVSLVARRVRWPRPASSTATSSPPSAGDSRPAPLRRQSGARHRRAQEAIQVTRSPAPELAALDPAARVELGSLDRLEGTPAPAHPRRPPRRSAAAYPHGRRGDRLRGRPDPAHRGTTGPRIAAPGCREPAALARPCRGGRRPAPRLWRGNGRGVRVECACA